MDPKRYGCLLMTFLIISVPCLTWADVSVNLKLDRGESTLADSVRMVVSVSGIRQTRSEPTLYGLNSFRISRGGTSSRVEIVNGRVNSSIEYTYFLQPTNKGTFQIGPAEIVIKGKTYRSTTATLKVTEPPKGKGTARDPLFLTAELSSQELYPEEQGIYTLKLFRRVRVGNLSLSLPDAEHVTFEQLGDPNDYQSVLDDKTYQVLQVRYALIASKEGSYSLGPARMNMTLYQKGRKNPFGLFDDSFSPFSTGRPVSVVSRPVEFKVVPFPEQGRPQNFTGLVGRFNMQSKLEPHKLKTGESATLTIRLEGRGNVNRIPDLSLPNLEYAKVYADQPVLNVQKDAKGKFGIKTMKWAVVPEKPGSYRIPPLSISYFDPGKNRYRILETPPLSMTVLPGKEETVQASSKPDQKKGAAKQEVKELGQDLFPVHTSIRQVSAGARSRPTGMFSSLVLVAPFLVFTGTFLGMRLRKKSLASLSADRSKKAAKILFRRCRENELSSNDTLDMIRDYLNARFDLKLGSLTSEETENILTRRGIGSDQAKALKEIVRRLEDAVYTGRGALPCEWTEELVPLIRQVDKEAR